MRQQTLMLTLVAMMLAGQTAVPAQGEDMLIRAAVRRILTPRMFTLEYRAGIDGELIVLADNAEATPVPGTSVLVAGVLRTFGEGEVKELPELDAVDARTRATLAGRSVLVAASVRTAAGRQLLGNAAAARASRQTSLNPGAPSRDLAETKLHAGAFAELIDEVGGRQVRLPKSRVLVVINPRVFLIESANPLPAIVGNLDRVLVLVHEGALRVDPALLVGSDVTVHGTARTLLGLQVTNEVPWPDILTRDITKRFEIRAAVLATSVQTADGVELTNRP
jgi:hypothetical protein